MSTPDLPPSDNTDKINNTDKIGNTDPDPKQRGPKQRGPKQRGPKQRGPKQRSPKQRGPHDLGGALGYGTVSHDPNEPAFHHEWEGRVFGLLGPALQVSGSRPGEFRHALERLSYEDYFQNGYYGRWLAAFELLLSEYEVLEPNEVNRQLGLPDGTGPVSRAKPIPTNNSDVNNSGTNGGHNSGTNSIDASLLPPIDAAETSQETNHSPTQSDSPTQRKLTRSPRFNVGDPVVAAPRPRVGHTRLPAYAEAKQGVIAELHGAEVLPDSTAHNLGERPQHVYAVAFDAAELWGAEAEQGVTVYIDMYECYLAPAEISQ